LLVNSVPSGADVRFAGEVIGVTPLERFGVPVGRYEVVLERDLFRPLTRVVTVPADAEARLDAALEIDPGSARLQDVLLPAGRTTAIAGLSTALGVVGLFAVSVVTPVVEPREIGFWIDLAATASLVRVGHLMAGDDLAALIITGANILGLAAGSLYVYPPEAWTPTSDSVDLLSNITSVGALVLLGGSALFDIAFTASAVERANARVLDRVARTGSVPSADPRRPRNLTSELGGASLARIGYRVPIVPQVFGVTALAGAGLISDSPPAVAPSLALRLDVYPFGRLTGVLRPYFGPIAVADTNFETVGVSVGYEFGWRLLTPILDVYAGSRRLFSLIDALAGRYWFVGIAL
jgi:hypothetical protein